MVVNSFMVQIMAVRGFVADHEAVAMGQVLPLG